MSKLFKRLFGLTFAIGSFVVLSSCNKETPKAETPPAETSTSAEASKQKFKVTFDTDGGSNIKEQEVVDGAKATKPNNPTMTNAEFLDWYNGDNVYSFDSEVKSNLTLKAKWQKYTYVNQTFGLTGAPSSTKVYFKDSYVNDVSTKFNKDLAVFSYGCALASENKDVATKFFNDLGFDKISYYGSTVEDYEGICYSFAHKKINDTDLVIVSPRGVGYSTEWAGNFDLGVTGNHKDYDECATKILNKLKTYIDTNKETSNLKILLTGYSRGGGVSNVLSYKLMNLENKLTDVNNLYSYTFGTPKGVLKQENINYSNVFNIINSADIITHLAPDSYGFTRCGIDIDIYENDPDTIIKNYNSKYELPKFSPMSGSFTKETEVPVYILSKLTGYETTDTEQAKYTLKNREEFVQNYQGTLSFVLETYFKMNILTKAKIIARVGEMAKESMWNLLSLISSGENLYNFLKPFLQEDKGEAYTTEYDQKLLAACNTLIGLVQGAGASLLVFAMDPYKDVIMRSVYMHTTATYYILLNAYKAN